MSRAARAWVGQADDGSTIVVEIADDEVEQDLARIWPPMGLQRVTAGAAPSMTVAFGSAADSLRVESALSLFAAERLAGLVAVHAALIVWDGAALVLPGPSHAGKTTLAMAAAALGAVVASDEYALIEPGTGLVSGWVRPLHVRGADGTERVDLAAAVPPSRVALLAAVTYDPDVGLHLDDQPPAEAAFQLLANTVCARSRPHEAMRATTTVARDARCVTGTRGEADAAIAALRTLLDQAGRMV